MDGSIDLLDEPTTSQLTIQNTKRGRKAGSLLLPSDSTRFGNMKYKVPKDSMGYKRLREKNNQSLRKHRESMSQKADYLTQVLERLKIENADLRVNNKVYEMTIKDLNDQLNCQKWEWIGHISKYRNLKWSIYLLKNVWIVLLIFTKK